MHAAQTGQFPNGGGLREQTRTMAAAVRLVHMAEADLRRATLDGLVEVLKLTAGNAQAMQALGGARRR